MGVSFFWERDSSRSAENESSGWSERETPHNSDEAGPSCDCRKSFSCLVLRSLTRLRQRRKLEGFSSRRISLIISASTKPVFRRISSKVVRSSQAMRMSELFSWRESRESETFLFLGTSYRGADSRGGQWKYFNSIRADRLAEWAGARLRGNGHCLQSSGGSILLGKLPSKNPEVYRIL